MYGNGKLEFARPVRLKHARVRLAKERFSVILEIPGTALIPDADAPTRETNKHLGDADGKRMLEEIRQILGPLSKTRAPVSAARTTTPPYPKPLQRNTASLMIIETTCENGLVRLPPGLNYRRDNFKVTVEIPDQELVLAAAPPQARTPQPMSSSHTEIRSRIDAILRPFKHQLQHRPPLSTEDYKDLWHQHLAEKHHDRD